MNVSKIRWMIGSVGLAVGLAGATNAQCFSDKLVDDNPGILNFMGSAVDIYGTTRVMLGAPSTGTGGRVYFFDRTGPMQWTEIDELVSPDAPTSDLEYFGRAVAMYSSFAVAGAPMRDIGSDVDTGKIHIYRRTTVLGQPAWVLDETITNPSPDDDDQFGASVDITNVGGVYYVAAGCPFDDLTGAAQGGRVRIYVRNVDTGAWSLQDTVVATTAQADANFGYAVSFDADRLMVGAPNEDVSGEANAGAAYLFERSGTNWGTGTRFVCPAANRDPGDQFGSDVAISGFWIAVGAMSDDEGLETSAGAIYMYQAIGLFWSFQQRILGLSPDAFDEIGEQIDLAGGVLVAGNVGQNWCEIWFVDSNGDWNPSFPFVATDPPKSDSHSMGSDCALSQNGEYLLVGDAADDIGEDGGGAGSAYIFSTDQNPGADCDGGTFDPVPILSDGDTWYGCNVGNPTDGSTCVTSHADGWYRFTPTCNGILSLSTCGTHDMGGQDEGIDTVLSVHTGCPGTTLNDIACNDDAPSGNDPNACGFFGDTGVLRDSALKVSVNQGTTYRIRVASWGASGPTGLFLLHVGFSCCLVDWDSNGVVNSADVGEFINTWFEDQANGTLNADFDGNGISNSTDVGEFINAWFVGCDA